MWYPICYKAEILIFKEVQRSPPPLALPFLFLTNVGCMPWLVILTKEDNFPFLHENVTLLGTELAKIILRKIT